MLLRSGWIALLSVACTLCTVKDSRADVVSPKPPEQYDVHIRYRIAADRNERVLTFETMSKFFASLGFVENYDDDNDLAAFDTQAEMMVGTIPSAKANRLLEDRRVQTIMFAPKGFKYPEDGKQRLRVSLQLNRTQDQLLFFKQTQKALEKIGFTLDVGYDPKRFTYMLGTIPAIHAPKMLRDLRKQPSGWLLPDPADELVQRLADGTETPFLVQPFTDLLPVRVVEILGIAEAPPAVVKLPPIPMDQPQQEKLTADLRRKLAEDGAKEAPLRVEVVLISEPAELDIEWRNPLVQAGVAIDGRIGSVVSLTLPTGSKALELAALEQIVTVRLPRTARVLKSTDSPEPKKEEPKKEEPKISQGPLLIQPVSAQTGQLPKKSPDVDPLVVTGVAQLHASNRKGQQVRVVILDTDFAGWQTALKQDKPANSQGTTTFIDLTAERQRDLAPDEMPGEMGTGTKAAMAVRLAAPLVNLTLVRIPVDAPYQLVNVGRYIRGDSFRAEGLITRRNELSADIESYTERRKRANEEYRFAFNDFDQDDRAEKRRRDAQAALKKLDEEVKLLQTRIERLEALEEQLAGLKGANIILCLLNWNTGFALDAASPMSRFLDDWLARSQPVMTTRRLGRPAPPAKPLWFQSAGDQRGQTWTGLFVDADKNGAMEFSSSAEPLRPGRWSKELNFIGLDQGEQQGTDLPNGAKIRISIQWREPHDPTLTEIDYRTPIVPLKLQLVRQRDPMGQKAASDEIDIVAESEGLPERLQIDPNFGIYEHSLEVTLPADGRYALRVEGAVTDSIRPAGVPNVDAQRVRWELRPRLFIESADGKARYTLLDYQSKTGGVPVPADARSVMTVGAAGPDGKPRASTSTGAGPLTDLATKPELLAPDFFPQWNTEDTKGSNMATAFTAGVTAALLSAGVQPNHFPNVLLPKSPGLITVPEMWYRK